MQYSDTFVEPCTRHYDSIYLDLVFAKGRSEGYQRNARTQLPLHNDLLAGLCN